MTTPYEIQALIDQQHERRQQLIQDLKQLGSDIADALVEGKSTTSLQKKQDSLRAAMMAIPSTVKRLQVRLAEAEADALLDEIRQLRDEEPRLHEEYQKLSDELADLNDKVRALANARNHAMLVLQSNQESQTRKKSLLIKQRDDLRSLADVEALLAQDHEQADAG